MASTVLQVIEANDSNFLELSKVLRMDFWMFVVCHWIYYYYYYCYYLSSFELFILMDFEAIFVTK
jgi:hypothetical protein